MISTETLELKCLDKPGLKTLVHWAELEGWNPSRHDYEAFWAADPHGFYGYYYGTQLIAGGAIVSYNGNYGFMGLFIVAPAYRTHGIGAQLWFERRRILLERLQPNAAIGMDGVVAMQPFYERGGFTIAFRDERYERIGSAFKLDPNISYILPSDIELLLPYDTLCFGTERRSFLNAWIGLPDRKGFKYMKNGVLEGFAVIRAVQSGYKIGPLFADSPEIAEALYRACLDFGKGHPVYLDVATTHKEAMQLIKTYKASYVFECARMYYGTPPKVAFEKIYGITTFELG